MPNATNVGTLFQDDEVGEAGLPEDMSRGDPRHAGADDHNPGVAAAGFGGGGSVVGGVDIENPMLAQIVAARVRLALELRPVVVFVAAQ